MTIMTVTPTITKSRKSMAPPFFYSANFACVLKVLLHTSQSKPSKPHTGVELGRPSGRRVHKLSVSITTFMSPV